ncbi:putative bifunctional diguanylate cyclase/phosphodiesterase [Mangrovibrevibacter kandeliae]|uniref:putative bifunctional diguanylate cyclase/phosphodiesterase n=1 Tax=Mangrovibrevibacter kandeliae TaxID=2968473 RepID=UPI002117693E|nr:MULTISPECIES: EAL domain-containing protein [unclassified Aurantimonas]MCQ8781057.1 EAL domain-containing protein [Aurantimonas sp. CSK15Z-1]MCW4113839.1 EAL domain-containing protein [Aurantimonas sp. MSK8Z-1]
MSIKLKLLLGCLGLTLITVFIGAFAVQSQRRVELLSSRIYDQGLIPVSYLRKAQNALVGLEADYLKQEGNRETAMEPSAPLPPERVAQLETVLAEASRAVDIAADGTTSEAAKQLTMEIRQSLSRLQATNGVLTPRMLLRELQGLDERMRSAVGLVETGALGMRDEVESVITDSARNTWQAIAGAVALAFVISFLLAQSIVPPLRNAMKIAKAIADGKLDNEIKSRGRSETSVLLGALATMQESISKQIRRIEQLMATQATSYDEQIAVQKVRFEAALQNMTQGLCMFDENLKLVVTNKRFGEMFGDVNMKVSSREILLDRRLRHILAPSGGPYFTSEMPDGRMIAIARQWIEGGGLVVTFEDITERHDAEQKLKYLARHDALTDLANRTEFRERLEAAILQENTAVLCLDLDDFKTVNDTLGHPVGDVLLQAVAERLRECVSDNDLVARIGGDEFAIIQNSANQPRAAEDLASRIIKAIARPFEIEHHQFSIGVSIGVVLGAQPLTESDAGTPADVLLKNGDLALYSAKAEGRSTFRFFRSEMGEHMQHRRQTELDLRRAMENDELELFYQPFFDVERQAISGFEALMRWRHPTRGFVSPGEFIPLAEDVGLIEPLGVWALKTACRAAVHWPRDLGVSVNLSPHQFRGGTLLEDVRDVLRRTGLEASRLQLEVTESLMLKDTDGTLAVLEAFRAMGIRVSMDDFGTGYSSLAYLSRFPFDKIKIDQSFVRDMDKPENLAVVRAVIGLSRAMGISVIAEGVETPAQYAALKAEGCEEMQGYLFSKPRPFSDIPSLLMHFSERRQARARTAGAERRTESS